MPQGIDRKLDSSPAAGGVAVRADGVAITLPWRFGQGVELEPCHPLTLGRRHCPRPICLAVFDEENAVLPQSCRAQLARPGAVGRDKAPDPCPVRCLLQQGVERRLDCGVAWDVALLQHSSAVPHAGVADGLLIPSELLGDHPKNQAGFTAGCTALLQLVDDRQERSLCDLPCGELVKCAAPSLPPTFGASGFGFGVSLGLHSDFPLMQALRNRMELIPGDGVALCAAVVVLKPVRPAEGLASDLAVELQRLELGVTQPCRGGWCPKREALLLWFAAFPGRKGCSEAESLLAQLDPAPAPPSAKSLIRVSEKLLEVHRWPTGGLILRTHSTVPQRRATPADS